MHVIIIYTKQTISIHVGWSYDCRVEHNAGEYECKCCVEWDSWGIVFFRYAVIEMSEDYVDVMWSLREFCPADMISLRTTVNLYRIDSVRIIWIVCCCGLHLHWLSLFEVLHVFDCDASVDVILHSSLFVMVGHFCNNLILNTSINCIRFALAFHHLVMVSVKLLIFLLLIVGGSFAYSKKRMTNVNLLVDRFGLAFHIAGWGDTTNTLAESYIQME